MKLNALIRGLPGHPLHPPLTDATIGAYTFATVAAVLNVTGIVGTSGAGAWWLALVAGLVVTVPTALTGLADWLSITPGTPLWRTATSHLAAMVTAAVLFLVAAIVGHAGYADGIIGTAAFVLTVVGFATMSLGGWLGGAIVFVHGMRVLGLPEEPALRAVSPVPHPEKVAAEK
jgi:uncharacterized membrane protein